VIGEVPDASQEPIAAKGPVVGDSPGEASVGLGSVRVD
jgi:hypothetical protein